MKRLLLFCLLWATPVFANDVIGCDPTHPLVPNAVSRFERAVDFVGPGSLPTTAEEAYIRIFEAPLSGFLIWVAPVDSMTAEQTIRMNTLRSQIDSLLPIPRHYWVCTDTNPVDGVPDSVTEMSPAQKTAMDAPDLAESQRQQAFTNEISSNDFCDAELSDIAARIDQVKTTLDGRVDAAPNNIAGIKSYLKNDLHPALVTAFKKVGKCIRARAR